MKEEVIRSAAAPELKATRQTPKDSDSLLQRTHCKWLPICTWTVLYHSHHAVISIKETLKFCGFSLLCLMTFNIHGKPLGLASGLINWIENQKDINPRTVSWPLLEKHTSESVTNDG